MFFHSCQRWKVGNGRGKRKRQPRGHPKVLQDHVVPTPLTPADSLSSGTYLSADEQIIHNILTSPSYIWIKPLFYSHVFLKGNKWAKSNIWFTAVKMVKCKRSWLAPLPTSLFLGPCSASQIVWLACCPGTRMGFYLLPGGNSWEVG